MFSVLLKVIVNCSIFLLFIGFTLVEPSSPQNSTNKLDCVESVQLAYGPCNATFYQKISLDYNHGNLTIGVNKESCCHFLDFKECLLGSNKNLCQKEVEDAFVKQGGDNIENLIKKCDFTECHAEKDNPPYNYWKLLGIILASVVAIVVFCAICVCCIKCSVHIRCY